ncbi:hypothetical protein Patl1_01899 [Pistacia atlantica]|uniref:Uncharacterized protein n=1 Tax=Pistacia atlantica TaxID=434234 RepID=A0ACC1CDI9_9ROSI|nr:hypothetical protein Patl1_01899 [Pistacia atlantica]
MLCILLTLSLLVRDTEGTHIMYEAIRRGDQGRRCSPRFPDACKKTPSNPYQRGRSTANRHPGEVPPEPRDGRGLGWDPGSYSPAPSPSPIPRGFLGPIPSPESWMKGDLGPD